MCHNIISTKLYKKLKFNGVFFKSLSSDLFFVGFFVDILTRTFLILHKTEAHRGDNPSTAIHFDMLY